MVPRRQVLRWVVAGVAAVAAADAIVLLRRPDTDAALEVKPAPSPRPSQAQSVAPDDVVSPRPPHQPDDLAERRNAHGSPADADPDRSAATAGATRPVVCRRDWGAKPPSGRYRRHELDVLTVHHTAVVADSGSQAERVRSHQQHHLDSGFVDLAYHFVIGRDGTVFEGRPVTAPGETFTDYDPAGHFLPCLEGNFDEQQPTPEQISALVDLLAWAAATFRVDVGTIAGHRRYASTRCPGDALQSLVDDGSLRRAVSDRLAAGGVALAYSC